VSSSAADGRFAPSPTGPLHVGNLRTALLAWLFARSAGARFLVRVEDLDRSRVRPGIEQGQLADLRAIGLDWDGPLVRQSERMALYEAATRSLETDGLLYPCYCTRAEIRAASSAPHGIPAAHRYPGTCRGLTAAERAKRESMGRPPALRVRSEGLRVAFEDRLLGEQPTPEDLLSRFDPSRLPREPTVWDPGQAARGAERTPV
jgi:glutamyl-tRNA synthetase